MNCPIRYGLHWWMWLDPFKLRARLRHRREVNELFEAYWEQCQAAALVYAVEEVRQEKRETVQ
jgi:hypothetical protein